MKMPRSLRVLITLLLVPVVTQAAPDSSKDQTAGDKAVQEARDFIRKQDQKADGARFAKISQMTLGAITKYPEHKDIGRLIDDTLRVRELEKAPGAVQTMFYTQMQSEVLTPLFDENIPANTRAALLALNSAMAEGQCLAVPTLANLAAWREKIDAQLAQPSEGDLLKNRVASYYTRLMSVRFAEAETFLKSLTDHADRNTSRWAKSEMKYLEIRKKPVELSFTAIDGKQQVDLATMRDRVVVLFFWASEGKDLDKSVEAIANLSALADRKKFAVVTICGDTDKEKALAAIKKHKIKWPVFFDGKGTRGDFCKQFGVNENNPVVVYLYQNGTLGQTPSGRLTHDKSSLEKAVLAAIEAYDKNKKKK